MNQCASRYCNAEADVHSLEQKIDEKPDRIRSENPTFSSTAPAREVNVLRTATKTARMPRAAGVLSDQALLGVGSGDEDDGAGEPIRVV